MCRLMYEHIECDEQEHWEFFTSILDVVVEITEGFVLPSLFRSLCRFQLVSHTLEPRHMNAIVARRTHEKKTFVTIAVASFVGRSYFMHVPCTLSRQRVHCALIVHPKCGKDAAMFSNVPWKRRLPELSAI